MSESRYPARYQHELENGKIQCDLCPRGCALKEGQRGFCFVRRCIGHEIVLTTYGRSSGFCIDPIEKKPLNHFYPNTSVLSFGTAGCNLGCRFCQNWHLSTSREMDRSADQASPESIALTAVRYGCRSVAFTYNDPVIFAEYAMDVARSCHEHKIKTVAVTAGYIEKTARADFFRDMDATNVDLKAFRQEFYKKYCAGNLHPVLETLKYLKQETDVWVEITNLLIPGVNDSEKELQEMTDWIAKNLGLNVPIHFSAFHPSFKMRDVASTPTERLLNARRIALSKGLRYVYTGNVSDADGGKTYCPNCKTTVIERFWYELRGYRLDENRCRACGHEIAGRFDPEQGKWGQKRLPIRIGL
ncbi:MAG: AmmeMemoRadiSam system radical SAM enzyme [Candidatus Cloacimonetes bacterium 4572_55]|nr:MAG: AmmeMemoRadiSam system radical SAM enzyme [Candidatus Cloacimonetes bacterium 4572_55]